ncbi:hypothetical protein CALVIDRAFT_560275 [Calocera viscosa TUFC12733]|uniref:Uncharacterized protein n=1 Tax=Calocera viscosa (strain TUFC12733) TaxID=1330018 RepID=A0A167RJP4_CALVF|nr:hypothetical protein CALVIDRAFT_560275 [Calocera viscosa TUFC12733]
MATEASSFSAQALEDLVVIRVSEDSSRMPLWPPLRRLIDQRFEEFVRVALDILARFDALDSNVALHGPEGTIERLRRRAGNVNPFIRFYHALSMSNHYCKTMKDEVTVVLRQYETMWLSGVYPPLDEDETLELALVPETYLHQTTIIRVRDREAFPSPRGFSDNLGRLELWARVKGNLQQVWLAPEQTLRLLFGQLGDAVLKMAMELNLGTLPAALQIRFVQDLSYAKEACALDGVLMHRTLLKSALTPTALRDYALGRYPLLFLDVPKDRRLSIDVNYWWDAEERGVFKVCSAYGLALLDKVYGSKLLSMLENPRWQLESPEMSRHLYLLHASDTITSYLLQCRMARLQPSAVMTKRILDIINELDPLLAEDQYAHIPIPCDLLPEDSTPFDVIMRCQPVQRLGRRPQGSLDPAKWAHVFEAALRALQRRSADDRDVVYRVRRFCEWAGIFYTTYHDFDYDEVPTELHHTIIGAIHTLYSFVKEKQPALQYVLPDARIFPKRIRLQFRNGFGHTARQSLDDLAAHIRQLNNVSDMPLEKANQIDYGYLFARPDSPVAHAEVAPDVDGTGRVVPGDRVSAADPQDSRQDVATPVSLQVEAPPSADSSTHPTVVADLNSLASTDLPTADPTTLPMSTPNEATRDTSRSPSITPDSPPHQSHPPQDHTNEATQDASRSPSVTPDSPPHPSHAPQDHTNEATQDASRSSSVTQDSSPHQSHSPKNHTTPVSPEGDKDVTTPSQEVDPHDVDSQAERPAKRRRVNRNTPPTRSSQRRRGELKKVKIAVENAAARAMTAVASTRDLKADPHRQILAWYYSAESFDMPIWISYRSVHLKQHVKRFAPSMGDLGCHEFDAVLVHPAELSAAVIRKWGWVVTAWEDECSVVLSHGIYRCQDCQGTAHPDDFDIPDASPSGIKKRSIEQEKECEGYVIRHTPLRPEPEGEPEGETPWHIITEICVFVPQVSSCYACRSRGRQCDWCKADLKGIDRAHYEKPTTSWVKGKHPKPIDLYNRLSDLHGRWTTTRPLTKSEKQLVKKSDLAKSTQGTSADSTQRRLHPKPTASARGD